LVASTIDKSLGHRLKALNRLNPIITDELGYMPINPQKANLFFQFVSARCESPIAEEVHACGLFPDSINGFSTLPTNDGEILYAEQDTVRGARIKDYHSV